MLLLSHSQCLLTRPSGSSDLPSAIHFLHFLISLPSLHSCSPRQDSRLTITSLPASIAGSVKLAPSPVATALGVTHLLSVCFGDLHCAAVCFFTSRCVFCFIPLCDLLCLLRILVFHQFWKVWQYYLLILISPVLSFWSSN